MSNAAAQEDLRIFAQRWESQPGRKAHEPTSRRESVLERAPSPVESFASLVSLPSKTLDRILLHLGPLEIVKLRLVSSPRAEFKQLSASHVGF